VGRFKGLIDGWLSAKGSDFKMEAAGMLLVNAGMPGKS
jgi:hypothetical protein